MLCDRCQKRDAKILYTEIINGVKKEQHLCEECATDYTSFQMEKPLLNSELTLGDLLSTLLDNYTAADKKRPGEVNPAVTCSNCGTSYEEFVQKGRFGCSHCYRSFNDQLVKTLKGIQGAEVHTGKRPKGLMTPGSDRIFKDFTEAEMLSLKLQEAIEKEEFEEAARLRDLIKQMKKEETNNA
ncbi:MAG: UvrB/UvrC motif-containing protein [Mobilitalea sp.]